MIIGLIPAVNCLIVNCLLEGAPYLSRPIPDNFESRTTAQAEPGVMAALLSLVTIWINRLKYLT